MKPEIKGNDIVLTTSEGPNNELLKKLSISETVPQLFLILETEGWTYITDYTMAEQVGNWRAVHFIFKK
jgi:hypothetical protein